MFSPNDVRKTYKKNLHRFRLRQIFEKVYLECCECSIFSASQVAEVKVKLLQSLLEFDVSEIIRSSPHYEGLLFWLAKPPQRFEGQCFSSSSSQRLLKIYEMSLNGIFRKYPTKECRKTYKVGGL